MVESCAGKLLWGKQKNLQENLIKGWVHVVFHVISFIYTMWKVLVSKTGLCCCCFVVVVFIMLLVSGCNLCCFSMVVMAAEVFCEVTCHCIYQVCNIRCNSLGDEVFIWLQEVLSDHHGLEATYIFKKGF